MRKKEDGMHNAHTQNKPKIIFCNEKNDENKYYSQHSAIMKTYELNE